MSDTYDKESVAPPSGEGEFAWVKRQILDGHRKRAPWRKEAMTNYEYVAGHQWSEADEQMLAEQHRPVVTFNRTEPLVEAVCGLEQNNRRDVHYYARKMSAMGPDEAIGNAVKWVRDECQAQDEESEAFKDLAICGEGWTETRLDYEGADPTIVEERIDPIEMGVNRGAKRANYSDARMMWRIRTMETADAESLFSDDLLPEAFHAAWVDDDLVPEDGGMGNKVDYPKETRMGVRDAGQAPKDVRVVQVQWWEYKTVYLVATANDTEPKEVSADELTLVQERAAAMGIEIQSTPIRKKCYYEAYVGQSELLEKREMPVQQFQWEAMTAKWDRKKSCFYGLVRSMRDPQMWANKWLSQSMHILNAGAKGGIMAEQDAFINVAEAEKRWADPTKIIWTKPGALSKQKIKERTPPPMPPQIDNLLAFAVNSLRDVTGVNLELMGQADREQAASLEQQRRQAAVTILATLFSSKRRYTVRQGKLLLHYVRMLPENTLIRVVDGDNAEYVPLVYDKSIEKYDIIVDDGPSSPDQKQAIWAMTTELIRSGIPIPPPVLIKLLKYSPYPKAVVKEITEAMGLGGTQPPEVLQQKLQQAEQALKVLEDALKKMQDEAQTMERDRTIEMFKVEVEKYKAKTARMAAGLTADGNERDRIAKTATTVLNATQPAPGGGGGGGPDGAPTPQPAQPDLATMMAEMVRLTGAIKVMMDASAPGPDEEPTDQSEGDM